MKKWLIKKQKMNNAKKKAEQDFEEAVKLEVDRRMKAKKRIKPLPIKQVSHPTEKRAKIADKLNEWADKFRRNSVGLTCQTEQLKVHQGDPDVQKMVSNAMRFVAEGVRDGKNIPEILKDAVKKFGENILSPYKRWVT